MKSSNLKLSSLNESGFFSGYASVFNVLDHDRDIILPGAFKNSLHEWQTKQNMPKMLWQHRADKPIGLWNRIEEDQVGLYVEGQLLLDIQGGKEAYTLLKNGVVDGLSIGFEIVTAQKRAGARAIERLNLYEISLVTFGANPKAKVREVKVRHPDFSPLYPQTNLERRLNRLERLQWAADVLREIRDGYRQ